MMNLVIRDDFKNLIPPLTEDEYRQLEQNILEDGIREPIIVWHCVEQSECCSDSADDRIVSDYTCIVDGHNRYDIALKHDLPFQTIEKEFDDESDVKRWIILNQFGRRNLPAYERARLALELKPLLAEEAKKRQGERNDLKPVEVEYNTGENILQKSVKSPINVQKELAKVAGVSHDTIAKVEKIEAKAKPEVKEQLRTGEKSINQAYQEIKREEREQAIDKAIEQALDKKIAEAENPKPDITSQPVVSMAEIREEQHRRDMKQIDDDYNIAMLLNKSVHAALELPDDLDAIVGAVLRQNTGKADRLMDKVLDLDKAINILDGIFNALYAEVSK